MSAFWNGFEKQANLLGAGKAFAQRMAPKAQAAWQTAKPVMQSAVTKGKAMATKGKSEIMKTPGRALGAGLAAGAAGTYALTRPQQTPMQYGAQAAYY
jgi:hypothetical protein